MNQSLLAFILTGLGATAQQREGAQDPVPVIDTTTLPRGKVGVEYSESLYVVGGKPPYTMQVTKGRLPQGLERKDSDIIGKPKESGYFPFALRVTDANGKTFEREFSIDVQARNLFDILKDDLFFTLRERAEVASDGDGSGPAKFSFTKNRDGEKAYTVDATLLWTYRFTTNAAFRISGIRASIDNHLSSDEAAERSVTSRLGITGMWHFVERAKQPHFYMQLNGLHESDQEFDEQEAGLELKLTPTYSPWGCGSELSIDELLWGEPPPDQPQDPDYLTFYGRPWFGAAGTAPVRQIDDNAEDDPVYRIFATVRAEVGSPRLAQAIGLTSVRYFTELRGYKRISERDFTDETHGFAQLGLLFGLSTNFSLEIGYKKGENAPEFDKHLRQHYASITVTF
jgi:hypothetical protein